MTVFDLVVFVIYAIPVLFVILLSAVIAGTVALIKEFRKNKAENKVFDNTKYVDYIKKER